MSKKIYFQIIIFISILIITAFVYFVYFKNDDKILVKSDGGVSSNNLIKNKDDLITEMKYYSEDEKGNRYEIEADNGEINPDQSNLIRMNKVEAIVYLSNGEKIFINSDRAEYNNDNNDTTFNGSVEMNYNNHELFAENLDLSFRNNFVTLYDKVKYNNGISKLIADKILIDLINKNTKILMDNENNNILVKSNLDNGNN
tara:strand:- start:1028 stop:1627 length:600 start_codon:yes stop_codon:yes gene_type:complete